MPKTKFLQIRLSPQEKEQIEREAEKEHLSASTWSRRVLLKEVERRQDDRPDSD